MPKASSDRLDDAPRPTPGRRRRPGSRAPRGPSASIAGGRLRRGGRVAPVGERDVRALRARGAGTMARPMPREPPVTRAALPVRSIMRGPPCGRARARPARRRRAGRRPCPGWAMIAARASGIGSTESQSTGQPDVRRPRADRRVAGDAAGRVGRPLDGHGAAREAGAEGDDDDPVADLDPALVDRLGQGDRARTPPRCCRSGRGSRTSGPSAGRGPWPPPR